jgi:hypothetical protein
VRDDATSDETIAGSGVVEPQEVEADEPLLADDAIARVLLYMVRHGEVYAGAQRDAGAIARVIGVPFTVEALEALAVAGLSA